MKNMHNHDESSVTLADVRDALARITSYIDKTPLLRAPQWSELAGVDVYLKCENLQRTGSFKLRGATNKVLTLLDAAKAPTRVGAGTTAIRGVTTASSGNHGQAVAYAAQQARLPCVVVVPQTVLAVKEEAIRVYGAEVIHCGTTSAERIALAEEIAAQRGLQFVPPYDDPAIVAGQGTVGLELVEQAPQPPGTVIVPIGGGGLTSGVALTVKSLSPNTTVWAAEPALASDTWQSVQAGEIVEIGESQTIADGLRSSHPGYFTFPLVQQFVDDVVLVEDSYIAAALLDLLQKSKLLVEPSGATSLAALAAVIDRGGLALEQLRARGPVVCVLSGGNADLKYVAKLALEQTATRVEAGSAAAPVHLNRAKHD